LVDPESVIRRLRHLGVQLKLLSEIGARGRETFDRDELVRLAAERALQVAIQAAADIANHVLAEDSDVTPEDYGSTFSALADLGVIDRDLARRLRAAAGLRNVLVHVYVDIDPDLVWAAVTQTDDLAAFAAAIERYVAVG
jgi:uncharacterized protein YutE (UPF0331/DUF86 family)